MRSFFLWKEMYGVALARVRNLLFSFLESPLTWVSKLNVINFDAKQFFTGAVFLS